MDDYLFEVSEEDSFSLLYKHVASFLDNEQSETGMGPVGSGFVASVEALVKREEETEEIQLPEESIPQILDLFLEQLPLLFARGTETDVESSVQLMNHHLFKKLPSEESGRFALALSAIIAENVENKSEMRLACLLHLYNASVSPEDQYAVLMKTIDYATAANLVHTLAPVLKRNVEDLVSNWKLAPMAASKLYLGIAALVRKTKGEKETGMNAIALTSKALAFIDASDSSACREVASEAAEVISDFLRAKDIFACDLLDLAPVRALAKNPTYLYLHHLFSAITKGQIDQLDAVCRPDLLEELGIDRALCEEKTRMTALLNVARASANKPIPYNHISDALQIDEADVERWIVKASGTKLLTARIDQIHRVVSIMTCASKGFDGSDWKQLRDQLKSWKDMLADMHRTMRDSASADALHSILRV